MVIPGNSNDNMSSFKEEITALKKEIYDLKCYCQQLQQPPPLQEPEVCIKVEKENIVLHFEEHETEDNPDWIIEPHFDDVPSQEEAHDEDNEEEEEDEELHEDIVLCEDEVKDDELSEDEDEDAELSQDEEGEVDYDEGDEVEEVVEETEEEEEEDTVVGEPEKEEEEEPAKESDEVETETSNDSDENASKEEEDEEEELFEIEIDDVTYCTNDEENGVIYELNKDGDVGNKVGYLKDGEPFFEN
jgi:hypothetical protein